MTTDSPFKVPYVVTRNRSDMLIVIFTVQKSGIQEKLRLGSD